MQTFTLVSILFLASLPAASPLSEARGETELEQRQLSPCLSECYEDCNTHFCHGRREDCSLCRYNCRVRCGVN
jgi:hypothetical protein